MRRAPRGHRADFASSRLRRPVPILDAARSGTSSRAIHLGRTDVPTPTAPSIRPGLVPIDEGVMKVGCVLIVVILAIWAVQLLTGAALLPLR